MKRSLLCLTLLLATAAHAKLPAPPAPTDEAKAKAAEAAAKTAWAGKVTTALFKALGITQPKAKRTMLRALMEMNEIVGQYCFPTGLIYADRTRDDPRTQDYKRLAYLNYASLQLDIEPDCKGELADYVKTEAAKIQRNHAEILTSQLRLSSLDLMSRSG